MLLLLVIGLNYGFPFLLFTTFHHGFYLDHSKLLFFMFFDQLLICFLDINWSFRPILYIVQFLWIPKFLLIVNYLFSVMFCYLGHVMWLQFFNLFLCCMIYFCFFRIVTPHMHLVFCHLYFLGTLSGHLSYTGCFEPWIKILLSVVCYILHEHRWVCHEKMCQICIKVYQRISDCANLIWGHKLVRTYFRILKFFFFFF